MVVYLNDRQAPAIMLQRVAHSSTVGTLFAYLAVDQLEVLADGTGCS